MRRDWVALVGHHGDKTRPDFPGWASVGRPPRFPELGATIATLARFRTPHFLGPWRDDMRGPTGTVVQGPSVGTPQELAIIVSNGIWGLGRPSVSLLC